MIIGKYEETRGSREMTVENNPFTIKFLVDITSTVFSFDKPLLNENTAYFC